MLKPMIETRLYEKSATLIINRVRFQKSIPGRWAGATQGWDISLKGELQQTKHDSFTLKDLRELDSWHRIFSGVGFLVFVVGDAEQLVAWLFEPDRPIKEVDIIALEGQPGRFHRVTLPL